MSENDESIFPRQDNREEAERQRILDEARARLDAVYEQDRICYKCRSVVPAGVKFCAKCGVLVSEERPEPIMYQTEKYYPSPAYGPPPISPASYKFWFITAGLILLGVLIYFFVFRR